MKHRDRLEIIRDSFEPTLIYIYLWYENLRMKNNNENRDKEIEKKTVSLLTYNLSCKSCKPKKELQKESERLWMLNAECVCMNIKKNNELT